MTGLQLEHWIIEVLIVLLGGWAVFKTLPREPEIDWVEYQRILFGTLFGDPVESLMYPQPLRLLEWESLQNRSDAVKDIFRRRLSGWILVANEERSVEQGSWETWAGLPSVALDWERPTEWLMELESALEQSFQRFLFVASRADCQTLLQFMHEHPAVRDFTGAVVCVHPEFDPEWLATHFTHAEMDVEANVSIPYFVCAEQSSTLVVGEASTKGDLGWKAIDVIECDATVQEWTEMDEPETVTRWVLYMATLLSKRKESV